MLNDPRVRPQGHIKGTGFVKAFAKKFGSAAALLLAAIALFGCVERKSLRTAPRQETETEIGRRCEPSAGSYGARSLRLLTNAEYQRTVQDLVGIDRDITQDFPREVRPHGMDNVTETSVVTEAHVAAYLKAAGLVAAKVIADLPRFVPCASGENEETCARKFLDPFAKKTFRGPLDEGEKARLMAVYSEARNRTGNLAVGIDSMVQAMLMAPRFLYRFEIGEAKDRFYELTAWELAQALSYTYWGTMPDDRLLDLAASGDLKKPEILAGEAKRLLESPRSRPILGDFAARWLGADGVLAVNKDSGKFPYFTSGLREKLLKETKEFFADLVLQRNGSFEALFAADFTMVDDELVNHYGGQRQGAVIRLPTKERVGILGHGSVLATYADAEETTPVKRGLFVLERILCQKIPSPPASLNVMPPPRNPQATTRERFAAHSKNDACSSCHVRIDGAGFGLEDMDAVGRFRAMESGRKVDASGELFGAGGKVEFKGTAELGLLISKNPEAQQCFVKQVRRYVFGRREQAEDTCSIDNANAGFATQGGNLKKLFLSIPLQESFLKRRP